MVIENFKSFLRPGFLIRIRIQKTAESGSETLFFFFNVYCVPRFLVEPNGLEEEGGELEEEQAGPRLLHSRHTRLHCTRGLSSDRYGNQCWVKASLGIRI